MKQKYFVIAVFALVSIVSLLYRFYDKLTTCSHSGYSYVHGRIAVFSAGYGISRYICSVYRTIKSDPENCKISVKYFLSWELCLCLVVLPYIFCAVTPITLEAILSLLVYAVFFALLDYVLGNDLTKVEIQDICEKENINVGYGAAAFYYHNYLKMFVPEILNERIAHFESVQQVRVFPELIILLPTSAVVKQYIDQTWQIERARELLPFHVDIAGVKQREYNITVYHLRRNNESDGIWCAIEYAQPLRQLWSLCDDKKICDMQLSQELQLFYKSLTTFLHDVNESHTVCKLLTYDDRLPNFNLAECILNACES